MSAWHRVMAETGRPRGLIDYATLDDAEREKAGQPPTRHLKLIWRPRTILYFCVWSGIGLALLFMLGTRVHTQLNVAKDRNPPYILMSDGSIRNAYALRLRNMERSEEHTSELQSLMRSSYAVFCLKKKQTNKTQPKS